jgi:hypothetical protein
VAKLQLVQDPAADALLESNPFALLVGMLLDQQYPMEHAFAGPKKIADRIGGVDPREVLRRIKGLPGFGEQKAKIFLALLGKQYGVTPKGWREAAGDYGKAGAFMSVADVKDAGSLEKVRSYKKQAKAAAKAAKA